MQHYLTLILSVLCFFTAHFTLEGRSELKDFTLTFDDFPDDSDPDLEAIFEQSNADGGGIAIKEFGDFTEMPNHQEEIDQQDQFGIDIHGLPSAIVDGCVNVITGAFQETIKDFSLPGAVPLELDRHYCGSKCKTRLSFLYGWQISHGAKLLTYKTKHHNFYSVLKGSDRHGSLFKGYKHDTKFWRPDSFFEKGITNCAFGEICAKNNLSNDHLFRARDNSSYRMETADKTCYYFEPSKYDYERESHTQAYKLVKLELPGGSHYRYQYDTVFGMPSAIDFFDREGTLVGGLQLKDLPKNKWKFNQDPNLTYLTSTGEAINYRFELYGKPSKRRAILSEVHPPHSPNIKYSYETIDFSNKKRRLIQRELPDQRILKIAYDKKDRVKQLFSPAGEDGAFVATYTFNYHKDKKTIFGDNRFAEVKNALGGIKGYFWRKHPKRLNKIIIYDEKKNPIAKERFRWGNGKKNKSFLTARAFEEGNGRLISYEEHLYDSHGNITCTSLYGNITGLATQSIFLKADLKAPLESECDVHKTYWAYDAETRRIFEDNGKICHRYSYLEGTDFVSADYLSYEGRIQIRHFYCYDASGAVSQEITDDGSADDADDLTDVSERLTKKIQNNRSGQPLVIEEHALNLVSGQNELICKTVNQYDRHGWLIAQSTYDSEEALAYTLEWQHDSHGNIIWEKDALGNITESQYDANDNLIFEQKPGSAARILTYDLMNRVVKEEQKGLESLNKYYRYDAMGNCILSYDIYGKKTEHEYDSQGRLIATIYPATEELNGVNPIISYKRDALGRASVITDAKGCTTSIQYNLKGKPTLIHCSDGTTEKFTYTLWGELAESTAADGTKIQYTYDPQGREIRKEWFSADGISLKVTEKKYNAFHLMSETDASGTSTFYTYDPAGRLSSEKTLERATFYTYDSLGRKTVTAETLEDGAVISHIEIHDALDRVIESYILYPNGEIGNRTLKKYDASGREIERREWNQAGEAITTTQYDLFGREVCTTNALLQSTYTVYYSDEGPRMEVIDPLGVKTATVYNPFGQPIMEQCFDSMGNLVDQIEYAYDVSGNKILRKITTDALPVETVWNYDSLNRLTETIEAFGTPEEKRVQRLYDQVGRLTTLIKSDGICLHYTYDDFGRKTSLKSSDETLFYTYQYDQNDNLTLAKDEIADTAISRIYDPYDQLVRETLPYGHTLSYTYNRLGNLSEVILPDATKVGYTYLGNRLTAINRQGDLSYTHRYTSYDASSNPTAVCLPKDAGTISLNYDLLSRPTKVHTTHWQEVLNYEAHFLKERILDDGFGKTTSSYLYDSKNQLLSENGVADHSIEYDKQGNPVAYDGNARKFNARNSLLDDGQHRYTYDYNGNRIADGVNTYRYDALDRLIEVVTPSCSYRYFYDALGRRTARFQEEEASYFLWQKDSEIGKVAKDGTIQELQILNTGNHAIAFELEKALYVPIHDIFGNVRALLDASGNCAATYRYSAFGEEQTQGILSPWRYSGKRVDTETGFIYFGQRYYDPKTLCWLTTDPLEDADGPNLYAYVKNNPLLFVDPDGCFSFSWKPNLSTILSVCTQVAFVVASGGLGIVEGFVSGAAGGIVETAADLAFDAAALYAEGGATAACAEASSTTISYNICKTIGRVAGAAFSCTPAGKGTQAGLKVASAGFSAAKSAKNAALAAKTASQAKKTFRAKRVASAAKGTVKPSGNAIALGFSPKVVEVNGKGGMIHILERHLHGSLEENASKFLPGIGRKELIEMATEACQKAQTWKIREGLYSTVLDTGKMVGIRKDSGSLTSKVLVVTDKNGILHTMYPW